MAVEVRASFTGLAQYAQLCRQQRDYVRRVDDLVSDSCANFAAFTGFMALFAGAYEDAHAQVTEALEKSATGAGDLGTNIEAVLADFRATDGSTSSEFERLIVRTEATAAYDGPTNPGDGLGMPGQAKTANAGLSTVANAEDIAPHLPQHVTDGLPGRTPPLPDADVRGLPTHGVELTTQLLDTFAAGKSIGDARDAEDKYEEFEGARGDAR